MPYSVKKRGEKYRLLDQSGSPKPSDKNTAPRGDFKRQDEIE